MIKHPSPEEGQKLAHDIGALFLNFGVLEHTLSLAISAALKLTEEQERPLVRGMFANAKIKLLNSYAKLHWNTEYQAVMKQLFNDLNDAIEYRNDFAHGHIFHDANGAFTLITFRGGHRFAGSAEPINYLRLASAVDELPRLCGRVQQLADDVTAGKAEPPPKPPETHQTT